MRSIRSEAPYLPSNVKFVAANNGACADGGVPPLLCCSVCGFEALRAGLAGLEHDLVGLAAA